VYAFISSAIEGSLAPVYCWTPFERMYECSCAFDRRGRYPAPGWKVVLISAIC